MKRLLVSLMVMAVVVVLGTAGSCMTTTTPIAHVCQLTNAVPRYTEGQLVKFDFRNKEQIWAENAPHMPDAYFEGNTNIPPARRAAPNVISAVFGIMGDVVKIVDGTIIIGGYRQWNSPVAVPCECNRAPEEE